MKIRTAGLAIAVLVAAIAAAPPAARAAPPIERAVATAPPVATQHVAPSVNELTATYRLAAVDSIDLEVTPVLRLTARPFARSMPVFSTRLRPVDSAYSERSRPPNGLHGDARSRVRT